MVQWYVLVTELVGVCSKWFVLVRSAITELVKDDLSANIRSGGVLTGFWCVPHLMRISYTFKNPQYFRGTGKSKYRCILSFLSLPTIVFVNVVDIKGRWFKILSGDDCVCSHG